MWKRHLAVYTFYLGIALLITWPLLTVIGTRLIGHPFGDSYEYARHIWWYNHALRTGQPLFYHPLLGYPDGISGLWLWAIPLQSFPAWLFAWFLPLPLAFNLTALLRLALNGWAMYVLVHHLTEKRPIPALLAGTIFMLYPTFQGHLAVGHIGLLALWPVPLYIHALLRLQAAPAPQSLKWLIIAAGLFVMSLLGSTLLLIYFTGPVTLLMLAVPFVQRNWAALRRTIFAVLLGGLLALVFIVPYLIESAAQPAAVPEGGDVAYSADLLTLFTPSFYHPLFTNLDYTHTILGIDPFERFGYIGIAAGALALIGAWRQSNARRWMLLAALAVLFSLGPLLKVLNTVVSVNLGEQISYITLPWLFFQHVPFISTVRTPARFNLTVGLAVAILAGYGAGWLWDRLRTRRWLIFVPLFALVIFDYQSFWPFPTVGGTVPEPVQTLAERDDVRAVFDMPWTHLLAQKDGLFLQTGHQKPLIAGHIARRTPVDPARLTILEETLDPALLDAAGVDILILHKEWAEDAAQMQAKMPGDLVYEDERIAVYDVPPPAAVPQFMALIPDDPAVEAKIDTYLYAPEPGWATITGDLRADGRDVTLLFNQRPVQSWQGMDHITFDLPVPIADAGYHALTLAVTPPCPNHFPDTQRCRSAAVDALTIGAYVAQPLPAVVPFARGVELGAYRIDTETRTVSLWWRFGENLTENDIRFVHVVDANGTLAAQSDIPLGEQAAGASWVEQITFTELLPGIYDVYTGWYTYPDFVRFPVLANVNGAADGWVHLGQIEVAAS